MESARMNIEKLRENFKKIKKSVLKKFPGATLAVDFEGKYYIKDVNNYRILDDMLLYPSQKSVYDAWRIVDTVTKVEKIIGANTKIFSDEKICKQSGKE